MILILLNYHLHLQTPHLFYKGALEKLKSRKKTTNSSPNNTSDLNKYLITDIISFED